MCQFSRALTYLWGHLRARWGYIHRRGLGGVDNGCSCSGVTATAFRAAVEEETGRGRGRLHRLDEGFFATGGEHAVVAVVVVLNQHHRLDRGHYRSKGGRWPHPEPACDVAGF